MGFFISILVVLAFFTRFYTTLTEEDAFLPDQRSFHFGLVDDLKNYSLVDNLDIKAKLRKHYMTKSGYKIGIYDDVLMNTQLRLLCALAVYKLGVWTYGIPEGNVDGSQRHVSPNNIPWSNMLNAVEFSESIVGKMLRKVVQDLVGEEDGVYVPYQVTGHIVRCGDSPKVHVDAHPEEDEISMVVYLNRKWRKNDYGDMYLYDNDKEIVAGVVPHYGRVVAWQSSIPYLPRPPSVAFKLGQLFLHVRFTKNETRLTEIHKNWLKNQGLLLNVQNEGLSLKNDKHSSADEINVETRQIYEAKSQEGKRIVVFDDLFPNDVLNHLRSVILNYGVYYYDDSYNEESDNVQWIAGFKVDKYVQSRMWGRTWEVAKFVSGGHEGWFPYDVSCNLIRNGDTTQIHKDCTYDEDEWTFLLYLNPEWSVNDYGETVFYESNDDNTEIITEVLPKYGRVVIFQGIIPHSARPPSRNFTGARLSFAVKFAKTEWIARHKAIQEEMKHFAGVSSTLNFMEEQYLNVDKEREGDEDPDPPDDDFESPTTDVKVQAIKTRLETLTDEANDLEKLRRLFDEVYNGHLETREQIGDLVRQFL